MLQAVADVGYESPSAIQAATIPPMLAGSDVVGLAQTGTGKTAAFAIPILSKIDTTSRITQALVLAPTRELALQVAEAFSRYGAHLPVNVLPIYGGSSYGPQLAGLKRGAQVVVGTPGRVIDHLEKGSLDLSHLDYLVLDEADEMLQMGFAEDVERILADTPEYKQVALFSATMPPAIRKITRKYLHDPVEVTVEVEDRDRREHHAALHPGVRASRKMDALTRLLEVEPFEAMIVFVRTKQATEEVAEKLRARGFSAAAINGDIAAGACASAPSPAQGRDDRHPGRHRRRGPRPRRRAHLARAELRHPARPRVLRAPHRPHRAGRPVGHRAAVRHAARAAPAELDRAGDAAEARRDRSCRRSTTSTTSASRSSASRSPRRSARPGIELFRKLIEDYERDNDVPMADIAAALALQSRDGERVPDDGAAAGEAPRDAGPRRARDDGPPRKRRDDARRIWRPTASRSASGTRSMPGCHRRRDRQRGRAAPQRLRPHRHPARLLARRTAREAVQGDAEEARAAPGSRAC